MMRLLSLNLSLGLAAAALMAEGLGLGSVSDANAAVYIVHKEGQPGVLELNAAGRVVTEGFDRPEWASSVVLGLLAHRNKFYAERLGADLAEPLLTTNIINFADLGWVAMDQDTNEEVEMLADDEFRQNVLAKVLGIDREEGTIEGAVTEHYIERDNAGYTLEEIASKQDIDAVFGEGQQKASGQQG